MSRVRRRIERLESRAGASTEAPWLRAVGFTELEIEVSKAAALRERFGDGPQPAEVNWIIRQPV